MFRYKRVVLYCDNEEITVIIKICSISGYQTALRIFCLDIIRQKIYCLVLSFLEHRGWQFSVIINRLSSLLIWYRATTYPQFVIALRWRVLNVPASLLHVNLTNNAYKRSLHIAGRKLIAVSAGSITFGPFFFFEGRSDATVIPVVAYFRKRSRNSKVKICYNVTHESSPFLNP